MKNKKVLIVILIVIIVVAGIGIGIAVANQQLQKTTDSNENTADAKTTSDVYAELSGLENAEEVVSAQLEIILSAEAELLDEENYLAEDDMLELALNERTKVATLDEGSYQLHIMTAPIEIDGSTYRLPSEPTGFEVEGSAQDVDLEIELERIAVEEMTKEQLLAVADRLDKVGATDVAQSARDRAESAPSVEGSAEDVVQDSRSIDANASTDQTSETSGGAGGDTPANTGGGSGSGENNSGSGGSDSTDPNAGKTWHEAVYENVWVVDQAAYQSPIYKEQVVCVCGAAFDSVAGLGNHAQQAGRGSSCGSYSVKQMVVGYETIPEQGHWEQHMIYAAGWY